MKGGYRWVRGQGFWCEGGAVLIILWKYILRKSSPLLLVFCPLNKYIIMMRKNASSKVVNFMTPRSGALVIGRGYNDYMVRMLWIFKKSAPAYLANKTKTTKYRVMMRTNISSKIVNFYHKMIVNGHWIRTLVIGWGTNYYIGKLHFLNSPLLLGIKPTT